MIHKIIYLALIGFSMAWGAFYIFDIELGFDLDMARLLPGSLPQDLIPPRVLSIFIWTCVGLTIVSYLIGLVKIYWQAGRDPWRAILFTLSALVTVIGLVFHRLNVMGLIDRSSLYLIAVMVLPFVPAIIYLPFAATYQDHLAPPPLA